MPITNAPPPTRNIGAAKPRPAKQAPETREREEALNGLGQLAQVPLLATKQYADAAAFSLHWPNISKEVAKLAESQEQVAKLIDPLIQVGPYTGLITALLPFVMQLAVNHRMVAAGALGTVPAQSLSAQMETAMVRAELEALKTQRDAEHEAAAVRKEIDAQRAELAEAQAA